MPAENPTLQACLTSADTIESSLHGLGDTSRWPAGQALLHACEEFRQSCRDLAQQKGLKQFAVAFIGPKNAGKTTFLSLLLRSPGVRQQLALGQGADDATERILWITPQTLAGLDPRFEERIPVQPADVIDLGCPYTLIDVPGANEANPERAQAAQRALQAAHLKVLVIEARTMEDAGILRDLQEADGAMLLPVINQMRPDTAQDDVDAFLDRLQDALPHSRLLPALQIPDFHLEGNDESSRRQEARTALSQRLRQVIRSEGLDELLEPQLLRLQARFQERMQQDLARALPATSEAAGHLQEIEDTLAVQALERLLGADDRDRAVIAGLRQQLRAIYQQRTPVLFFPWRTFVSLANLLHGALEKMPFLLAGSLPSLISSTMTAVKNVTRDRDFQDSRREGLRQHAEWLLKESLYPRVDHLEAAIRSDLRQEPTSRDTTAGRENLEVDFEGLEVLQARSTTLFQEVLDSRAPGRAFTWLSGLVGLTIFWGIFIWPFLSLYRDYFEAVRTFVRDQAADAVFPMESFSMIGTSFLLALFPMLFWLLLMLSWVGSQGRALDCLQSLRQGHQSIIEELNASRLLRVRARHPHLQACLRLFSLRS